MHYKSPKQLVSDIFDNITTSKMTLIGSMLGFGLIGHPADAATFTYPGTTSSGGSTFQAFVSLAPSSYSVFEFGVDTADVYSFSSTSTGWQNAISLYEVSFDPNRVFTNLRSASTNAPNGLGVSISQFVYPLDLGVNYFLVTSGLRSSDFGNFSNAISGRGNIVVTTAAAVPEPFTVIGTLIGGTAAVRIRKKLANSHKM
ncbi:PEP-CTERM sorting domain-containing protein [Chamaesiphon sp.]|uniref:PEP-CTERM sorting domain-containing protein n=1 Tax=Chamaesiphon sp. TaxID=2814140 RepID=UPI00359307C6